MRHTDKHLLVALILICLVTSLSLSQAIAGVLLCQFCARIGDSKLCQTVVLVSLALGFATITAAYHLLTNQRSRTSLLTLSVCLLLACCSIVCPSLMLQLNSVYTLEHLGQLMLQANVTKLGLVAGDSAALLGTSHMGYSGGCQQKQFMQFLLGNSKGSGDQPSEEARRQPANHDQRQQFDVCLIEAARFMSVQIHLCSFNACLVAFLILMCARLLWRPAIRRLMMQGVETQTAVELQQQQQQQPMEIV